MRKKMHNLLNILFIFFLLTACESKVEQADLAMQAIRTKASTEVTATPSFDVVPSYSYGSSQLKSPFIPSSLADELIIMAGKRVYPDFSRPLQPLENYTLEELYVKGILRNQSGKTIALISTPDNHVESLQVGQYMGSNYGRVVNISSYGIDLIELVSDGLGGYIERPRIMILHSTNK